LHLPRHTGPATALTGTEPALGHHYERARVARPIRTLVRPFTTRRIRTHAHRAGDIASRQDQGRTPLTTRSRPQTRPARRGTPHTPTHASRARRIAARTIYGSLVGSWRAQTLKYSMNNEERVVDHLWGRGQTLQPAPAHRPQRGRCTGSRRTVRALHGRIARYGRTTQRGAYHLKRTET
jgi:hypothetical protein